MTAETHKPTHHSERTYPVTIQVVKFVDANPSNYTSRLCIGYPGLDFLPSAITKTSFQQFFRIRPM